MVATLPFSKTSFSEKMQPGFSFLSDHQPAYNTQAGSPTSELFLICRFYMEIVDIKVNLAYSSTGQGLYQPSPSYHDSHMAK